MKTFIVLLGFAFVPAALCAAPDPAKLKFSSEPLTLPPLSLADEMKRPVTPSMPLFSAPRPAAKAPPRPAPAKPARPRLPIIEPNPDIDFKMVVVIPDPNIDPKMVFDVSPESNLAKR